MSPEIGKSTNINSILPAEILSLIFRQLVPLATFPHPDYKPAAWLHLKTMREVCQLWRASCNTRSTTVPLPRGPAPPALQGEVRSIY